MTKRKPPSKVVALRGEHKLDVVLQAELAEMEKAQLVEWEANRRAHLLSERIRARIEHGARVQDGKLYFDKASGLVRTRKQKAGGE